MQQTNANVNRTSGGSKNQAWCHQQKQGAEKVKKPHAAFFYGTHQNKTTTTDSSLSGGGDCGQGRNATDGERTGGVKVLGSLESHSSYEGNANIAQPCNQQPDASWIFDSGATDTMTYDPSDIVSKAKPKRTHIRTADGGMCHVEGGGKIEISPTLKLSNCLYIPSLSHKLLSISHVTKELNCTVLMHPTFCILQDIRTGVIIGRGTEHQGLYYVDEVTEHGTVMLAHGTDNREAWLWHRRLGHPSTGDVHQQGAITIGEALEATARTAGNKAVEQSDASAIQAAEVRATGSNVTIPGGLAAQAQSAATLNISTCEKDKVKLSEVLTDATLKLPADKAVTREDADGVFSAERRNNPNLTAQPAGVAASISAAANLNEKGLGEVV